MSKKKVQSNASYDKMADSLDTDFDGEIDVEEEMRGEIEKVGELKKDIVNMEDYQLEDAHYMEQQIKKALHGLKYVSDKLEQEIKVGCKPRFFEVYATLANAKMAAIKELRELRKIILDIKVKLETSDPAGKQTNIQNNYLDAKAVRELVKEASSKNSMKKIKAEFKIEDDDE